MSKIKSILFIFLIAALLYTRLVGINWGLPYTFHPDERNMAVAVTQLKCEIQNSEFRIQNCLNPNFFAYGQLPLYLGYFVVFVLKFFDGDLGWPISIEEAILALRLISVLTSILNFWVIWRIMNLIIKSYLLRINKLLILLPIIFSPFFIQFAHFGTTESLLMLLYSLIIYYSLKFIDSTGHITPTRWIWLAVFMGMAIGTKVSSLVFLIVPISAFLIIKNSLLNKLFLLVRFTFYSAIFSIIFSPHNLISLPDFLSAINYESGVALGKTIVFYTRQFVGAVPIIFQLKNIFPYALGWPVFILGVLGFFALSWKDKKINILRFAFLVYFLPNAFIFAKWTRFMSPIFPLILVFASLFVLSLRATERSEAILSFNRLFRRFAPRNDVLIYLLVVLMIIPGIAYLSIYRKQDIRLQASDWIYKNIKENSNILSETANVVDIPIEVKSQKSKVKSYNIISFNFYDLDIDPILQSEFKNYLSNADYIFVPSRRLFKNHSTQKYPILNDYYQKLFSGKLGFKKVAEFTSYPSLCFVFRALCFVAPDENAEETWSVFDHPVVRIYKRV